MGGLLKPPGSLLTASRRVWGSPTTRSCLNDSFGGRDQGRCAYSRQYSATSPKTILALLSKSLNQQRAEINAKKQLKRLYIGGTTYIAARSPDGIGRPTDLAIDYEPSELIDGLTLLKKRCGEQAALPTSQSRTRYKNNT